MTFQHFHVIIKVIHGEGDLGDDGLRRLLLSRLKRIAKLGGRVIAFAILPSHVHFLIRIDDEATLSYAMGPIISTVARARNENWEQRGPVFEPGFWRKPVRTDSYFRYLIFYIHANVRPAFTHFDALDVGWQSSHALWRGVTPHWLDAHAGLAAFGGWEGYRAYCEVAVGPRRLPSVRVELAADLEYALLELCRERGLRPETVLSAHRGGAPDRQAFAHALHQHGVNTREIADILGSSRNVVLKWLRLPTSPASCPQ